MTLQSLSVTSNAGLKRKEREGNERDTALDYSNAMENVYTYDNKERYCHADMKGPIVLRTKESRNSKSVKETCDSENEHDYI